VQAFDDNQVLLVQPKDLMRLENTLSSDKIERRQPNRFPAEQAGEIIDHGLDVQHIDRLVIRPALRVAMDGGGVVIIVKRQDARRPPGPGQGLCQAVGKCRLARSGRPGDKDRLHLMTRENLLASTLDLQLERPFALTDEARELAGAKLLFQLLDRDHEHLRQLSHGPPPGVS